MWLTNYLNLLIKGSWSIYKRTGYKMRALNVLTFWTVKCLRIHIVLARTPVHEKCIQHRVKGIENIEERREKLQVCRKWLLKDSSARFTTQRQWSCSTGNQLESVLCFEKTRHWHWVSLLKPRLSIKCTIQRCRIIVPDILEIHCYNSNTNYITSIGQRRNFLI